MTTANRDRWTLAIAGFSIPAWVFALRTWVAMMTALYAAFWLQLDSASSAAHRRHSRAADAGAGLSKGYVPSPRHRHWSYRVVCDCRVSPAEPRAVHDRLRGVARALRVCRRAFGWWQGLRRRLF